MSSVSKIALGVALALGLAGAAVSPATAQVTTLSKQERAALLPLQTALTARNYVAAAAALPTAQQHARSPDAKYLTSVLQLKLGMETNNSAIQAMALEAMIESGAVPASELPQLYKNQGALALSAGKYERAETAFGRWAELAPGDPEALLAMGEAQAARKNTAGAAGLIERAITIRRAAGQPVPESWYKRGLKHAYDARLAAPSIKFSQDLVAAYPTAENWRDALLIYRDLGQSDASGQLDALRLMRSAKALAGERDYLQLAQALSTSGYSGESKAVLEEGIAAKMVDPGKATFKELIVTSGKKSAADKAALKGLETKAMAAATGTAAMSAGDAYLAQGQYSKASELYRAAIQKGSIDANVANSRLGMALALAGQRPEAEAALRAVTGPRADLASYWLLWLSQRA